MQNLSSLSLPALELDSGGNLSSTLPKVQWSKYSAPDRNKLYKDLFDKLYEI